MVHEVAVGGPSGTHSQLPNATVALNFQSLIELPKIADELLCDDSTLSQHPYFHDQLVNFALHGGFEDFDAHIRVV